MIHNAARLNQHATDSHTGAWTRYFASYFPGGRTVSTMRGCCGRDWRTDLLKKQASGPGVVVTHGQSAVHSRRNELGRLCINLEDMWTDFPSSVDPLVEQLRIPSERRSVALRRARESQVAIIDFTTTVPTTSAPASGCAPQAEIAVGTAIV